MVHQKYAAMKVTTDACLFGAWAAEQIRNLKYENLYTATASEVHANKFEKKSLTLLDIGTGTGLLSLMIAQKNDLTIDAVEIDDEAAKEAASNIALSDYSEKMMVHEKDILDFDKNQYDYIVCNPPFYENDLQSPDHKKNLAQHSSNLTLAVLLKIVETKLHDSGQFFLLLPYKRLQELDMHLNKVFSVSKKIFVMQTKNHQPFRVIIMASKGIISKIEVSEIYIKDETTYSKEFTALLKDYYLHL